MSVHIGNIIKAQIKNKGISVTEFAKQINYSRRNLYEIFEKDTIDTGVLVRINKILNENLFLHYIELKELENIKTPTEDLRELIDELKVEVNRLKQNE